MTYIGTSDLAAGIKSFFSGDVEFDDKAIAQYSHDASLFEVKPQLVVFPRSVDDVEKLVSYIADLKRKGYDVSLTGRSAGTDMTGGSLSQSIVVVFTRYFNHEPELGDGVVSSQPGVYYRDFEKITLKKGWLLPSYTASRELCAIGGMVANNSGGELTLTYGKTEHYIKEIKMVLRDGKEHTFRSLSEKELKAKEQEDSIEGDIYRRLHKLISANYAALQKARPDASKNSTGYYLWNVWDKEKKTFDINQVIVGSQGTFGLITKATFSLIKPENKKCMLVMFLPNLDHLVEIVHAVLRYKPESFESYDDHTFMMALRLFPQIAARLKGNLMSLGIRFIPEGLIVLRHGMPKLVLMAEFADPSMHEARRQALAAQKEIEATGIPSRVTHSKADREKYWVIRRESFNLLRQHVSKMRTAPFIDDFAVRPEKLPEFLPRLNKIMSEYKGIIYTIAGHVGDGNFHIIPLMDLHKPESRDIIKELGERVYALVKEYHGTISGEHNDGIIRTPYVEFMYGKKIYGLFQETKKIFDPDDVFNPGKKVNGDFEYAMEHIAQG